MRYVRLTYSSCVLYFATRQALIKFYSGQRCSSYGKQQCGVHHQMLQIGRLQLQEMIKH